MKYRELDGWELIEDFCRQGCENNSYESRVFRRFYYSILKRNSNIKANELYKRVRDFFLEYLEELDRIRNPSVNK